MKRRRLVPDSYLNVSVSDLYIPRTRLPIWLVKNRQTNPGNIPIAHIYMNVDIGRHWAFFFCVVLVDGGREGARFQEQLTADPWFYDSSQQGRAKPPNAGLVGEGSLVGTLVFWSSCSHQFFLKSHLILPRIVNCTSSPTYRYRARICKLLRSQGINSKESIPPAYVACRIRFFGIDSWAP